ncbi:MAG: xylulokinase [Oscillospiraceae bacterium]|nr:xylulokinase [Oscillospiraceae bacterium]
MNEYVLGVDIGSGSVKLTLLSREGKIAGTAGCEYPTFYPQVGWCEQEPEDWCKAFATALAELLKTTGISADAIKALAPDAATHTAVLLDENRQVLRKAILWTDQRCKEQVGWLKGNCLEAVEAQCLNTPTTVWTLPQFMWLRDHEPKVWSKVRYILFAKDYLRYRLTGTMETDHIDAAGSMFYDVMTQCWSKELCALCGIEERWLPRLCDPADTAGAVTEAAAKEFGLAPGTQVLVGTTDTVMEVLAAGNVAPGHTTVKLATAGRICVISEKKLDSKFIFNYRHVVPGLWYPGTATASCANSYRWYRDTIGREPFADLNVPAEKIPAGSDGLMFHPYLNGELTPYNDPELRGSYIGISAGHTTAHFTRATLEGVAMSLRDCMGTLDELGVNMTRVRIIGGGAKGALWRQIVADVLGMPLEKVKVDDSSFGTAMLAAVGIGWFDSYAAAAEACIEIDDLTVPQPETQVIYDKLFKKYKAVATALAPIYHS